MRWFANWTSGIKRPMPGVGNIAIWRVAVSMVLFCFIFN